MVRQSVNERFYGEGVQKACFPRLFAAGTFIAGLVIETAYKVLWKQTDDTNDRKNFAVQYMDTIAERWHPFSSQRS